MGLSQNPIGAPRNIVGLLVSFNRNPTSAPSNKDTPKTFSGAECPPTEVPNESSYLSVCVCAPQTRHPLQNYVSKYPPQIKQKHGHVTSISGWPRTVNPGPCAVYRKFSPPDSWRKPTNKSRARRRNGCVFVGYPFGFL